MEILNYQVSDGQSGIRIDRYLSEMNEELSRSYIQKLLKEQKITVNGSAVKANYKVQEGDEISVAVPDIKEPDILPEDIPLDILYEDDDVLIVNKPKGMVVHPSAGHTSGTLVNAIMFHCKDNRGSMVFCVLVLSTESIRIPQVHFLYARMIMHTATWQNS